MGGHSATGKGPSVKGPWREFRALTSADQKHETEPAERDLQRESTRGAQPFKTRGGVPEYTKPGLRFSSFGCAGGRDLLQFLQLSSFLQVLRVSQVKFTLLPFGTHVFFYPRSTACFTIRKATTCLWSWLRFLLEYICGKVDQTWAVL